MKLVIVSIDERSEKDFTWNTLFTSPEIPSKNEELTLLPIPNVRILTSDSRMS